MIYYFQTIYPQYIETTEMRFSLPLCLAFLSLGVFSLRSDPQLDAIVTALQGIDDPGIQTSFLKGILGGLAGRRDVDPPKGWSGLKSKLEKQGNKEVMGLVGQIGQVFGDESAGDSALATLMDSKASLEERKLALAGLVAQKNPGLPPKLALLLDQPIGIEATRAYSAFDFKPAPKVLLSRYSKLGPEERRVVVETLASRKPYARALVTAMGKGKVAKEEIPAYVARNLQSMLGDSFEKVYGKVQAVSADKDKQIAQYKSMILASDISKADVSKGRSIYQRTCAACHIMYGEGGKIGPELTGSNRSDLDYFLLNVLAPSYDVPEGYRMVIITSKDGQVSVGNVIEEDANKVVLNMVGQQSVIAKADVKTRVTSKTSMMPEGLLLALKDHEILDLVKYLRTEKQVPLPSL
jgi:putative heme-binding domain-containing protein